MRAGWRKNVEYALRTLARQSGLSIADRDGLYLLTDDERDGFCYMALRVPYDGATMLGRLPASIANASAEVAVDLISESLDAAMAALAPASGAESHDPGDEDLAP